MKTLLLLICTTVSIAAAPTATKAQRALSVAQARDDARRAAAYHHAVAAAKQHQAADSSALDAIVAEWQASCLIRRLELHMSPDGDPVCSPAKGQAPAPFVSGQGPHTDVDPQRADEHHKGTKAAEEIDAKTQEASHKATEELKALRGQEKK